jgi:peptidoglycan/LPS O-acetylase OafA/YrhL
MKERNYTIEFFRIMFAINFLAVHVYMVYPTGYMGMPFQTIYALDNILPFMLFAGFFLMQSFKKQQKMAIEKNISPGRQAWTYLKARLIGLMPAFLLAQIMGFFVVRVSQQTPLSQWPIAFINHIFEFMGLQITGLGMGNGFDGIWGEAPRSVQMLNSPMWFISGIFVLGYLVYYFLARNERTFIGLIAPFAAITFYASQFIINSNPNWFNFRYLDDFGFAEAFPHMFVGLSLGCLLYVAYDKLKEKKWSRGMKVFLAVTCFITSFILIYKTWVPVNMPFWGQLVNINWASVHLISLIMAFLLLLNADGFTKLLNRKIWKTPGRLAFYVYMFHYPIIVTMGMVLKINDLSQMHLLYVVSTVVTVAFSYGFMKLNDKVIQPWLKNKPWYSKEQKRLEATGV